MSSRNDIAIIGAACRFPGASNPRAFWRNLRDGVESIRRVPSETLREWGVPESDLAHPGFVPAGGVLDGVEDFDAEFFRIIPRHAEMLDPQQRLLLECAWEVLESAGYDPEQVPGAAGVYLSIARSSYAQAEPRTAVERLVAYASEEKDYAATRISYKLNLKGPSLTVQSASSSSLVAVHMACQSL
ncbi:MAG TPA: polyketide synthase, partial [Thermoanaerobaculia bacterium]